MHVLNEIELSLTIRHREIACFYSYSYFGKCLYVANKIRNVYKYWSVYKRTPFHTMFKNSLKRLFTL